jgi:HAD superfamily hydrolase (TIGR01509 family)
MLFSEDRVTVSGTQLVIFDCDGVLVDSEPISNDVLAKSLTAQGLPTTLPQARREYQGLLMSEIVQRAQERLGRALPDDWQAQFERDRAQAFHRELRPVTGAVEAIERVNRAGIAVCVASQGKLAKTRLTLGITGLRELFADGALFSAHDVPRGKPHPDLFLHAAATMGAQPGNCTVIEDTPSGVSAAVAAGMRVLGFAADSSARALRAAGAHTFDSLGELPGLLGVS